MSALAAVARTTDEAVARARRELVQAVRSAHRAGMTQAQIAQEIGRSQPEVSRLLRFHGSSARAMSLRRARTEVLAAVAELGGSNVRVFGSVATQTDHDASDIDLLIDLPSDVSLFDLAGLELELSEVVGTSVDVVPVSDLRGDIRDRVLQEAVPL